MNERMAEGSFYREWGILSCKIKAKKRTLNHLGMKRLFQMNWFGIASIASPLAFQIYVRAPLGQRHSIYIDVAFVGIMTCAIPAALIAAWRGSKLWLLSLLGPLSGWMLVLSARA
jgi:hypothetical protein